MRLHAPPVSVPAPRKAAPSAPAHLVRAGPPRGAVWQAIQRKAGQAQPAAPGADALSRSGLPAPLKAGIERLSGIAMDGVRVHRNSAEPARVGALAFARGSEIHLGPGQERHLPHEAWHVVQQAQGRVKATLQMTDGIPVNDDAGLEREADLMGARAASLRAPEPERETLRPASAPSAAVAQRNGKDMEVEKIVPEPEEMTDEYHAEDPTGEEEGAELKEGDLKVSEIGSKQREYLALALVVRHETLFKQFKDLCGQGELENSSVSFLEWFNDRTMTRSKFKEKFTPKPQTASKDVVMQEKRNAGPSYQPDYDTTNFGKFKAVTYTRDTNGAIDFAAVTSYTTWKNPVQSGSGVDLSEGCSSSDYGITLSGTKVKIAGARRGTHFSIANRIMANSAGSSSPTGWTWHHLPAKYKMVLVDRKVHQKHGHNGGVYLWK